MSRKREVPLISMITLPRSSWWDVVVELHDIHVEIRALKLKADKRELGKQWSIKRGVLFIKNRIYLSEDLDFVPVILQQYHECGHEGFYKTLL